jgi:hypothetical protein
MTDITASSSARNPHDVESDPTRGLEYQAPSEARRDPTAASWGRASRTSAPTVTACCSSSRSTSASPFKPSPSARGWCWPSAGGSTADLRPRS